MGSILKYLTQRKECPASIVKYLGFYKSRKYYFLIMEDGGSCLFDFVQKAHSLIADGIVDIDHWQNVSQIILKQMIECIDYIHSKNVAHFDISLENFLISDVEIEVDSYMTKR